MDLKDDNPLQVSCDTCRRYKTCVPGYAIYKILKKHNSSDSIKNAQWHVGRICKHWENKMNKEQTVDGKYTVENMGHWECESGCGEIPYSEIWIYPIVNRPVHNNEKMSNDGLWLHRVEWVEDKPVEDKPEPTNRLYWQMTEVFVKLHGNDVCSYGVDCPSCQFIEDTFSELFTDKPEPKEALTPDWDKPEPEGLIDVIEILKRAQGSMSWKNGSTFEDIRKVIKYFQGIEKRKQEALDLYVHSVYSIDGVINAIKAIKKI